MENKKISVEEFIDKHNTCENKIEFVKKYVLFDTYIKYEEKITSANNIIKNSYYKNIKGFDGKEEKVFKVDSCSKYMLYCLEMIRLYTNISIDFKKSLEQFNILNSSGVLDLIINLIPERELKEYRMVMDFIENDLIQNEFEIHSYVSEQVKRFSELFASTVPSILKNIDTDKIKKIVELF